VPTARADVSEHDIGDLLKRNYRQAKRQKEEARKTRQLQKQQRRSDRTTTAGVPLANDSPAQEQPVDPPPLTEA
jgi:hypothetical protein